MSEWECLEDLLRRERALPVDLALSIAYQLAEFFSVAHASKLFHGAVFPSAILVASSGRAIVDFDSERCGTRPAEAKPEDDVSGLGGLIYEMLCGRPPSELLPVSKLRPEAPAVVSTLVASMLAVEPSARPTMADVARQLAPYGAPPVPEDPATVQLRAELEERKQAAQWEPAIETTMRLLEVESDYVRKARLSSGAAEICRDQLMDNERAIEHFDCALDAYFAELGAVDNAVLSEARLAFARLEAILFESSRWRDLDRACRKMIARTKSGGPTFDKLRAEMFIKCGEIYRTHMGMPEAAEAAFAEARKLNVDPRVDGSATVKRPDIAALEEQLTHKLYNLRFQAWDGLMAAFGLESLVRAPVGQRGKGSTMVLLKDFLASDCKAFVRMGAEEIRAIIDKLAAGATPESLGIVWQPNPRPEVTERMLEAIRDPRRAFSVEEIATLSGQARRRAEVSLALGVEQGDERVLDALVRLDAVWTLPILEELVRSQSLSVEFRKKLADAIRELGAS
jgi:hypothetical protein